jgi:hypothetical protein
MLFSSMCGLFYVNIGADELYLHPFSAHFSPVCGTEAHSEGRPGLGVMSKDKLINFHAIPPPKLEWIYASDTYVHKWTFRAPLSG